MGNATLTSEQNIQVGGQVPRAEDQDLAKAEHWSDYGTRWPESVHASGAFYLGMIEYHRRKNENAE